MSRTPSVYSDAPEIPADETMEHESSTTCESTPSTLLFSQRQLQHHHQQQFNYQGPARPTAMVEYDPDADPIEQDAQPDEDEREMDDGDDCDDCEQDVGGDDEEAAAEVDALPMRTTGAGFITQLGGASQMDIDDAPDRLPSSSEETEMQIDHAPLISAESQVPSNTNDAWQATAVTSEQPTTTQVGIESRSPGSMSNSGRRLIQNATSIPATVTPIGRAVSVPVVDEKAQAELRRKIMEIQRDPKISFPEKAGLIQKLMSGKWQESQKTAESSEGESGDATEDDLKTTYFNEELNQLGCKHYRRGCKLKANCCGKWFNCRFCHDDASDHTIVRSETKLMLCMHCKTIQDAAQSCQSCKAQLAVYYCDVCKLWDDAPQKPIYHCEDCGICRVGQGLGRDYFHCKKCNVCMTIGLQGKHKCIERNLECDCPICGEYMFTSTTTVIFMPCGHCIHAKCHEDYTKTSYQCPTCWKSLGDMTAYYSKIDSLLAEQTMPPDYANIFSIVLCNDCEVKSEAPYHFLYHRCDKCKGYNTKVLETFKRVADGQVQAVENATAGGPSGTAPENNLSGSNHSPSGPSSTPSGYPSAATGGSSSTARPRSPVMDGNASGDMSMAGISGNSAP